MDKKRQNKKQAKVTIEDHDPVEVALAYQVAVDMGAIPEILDDFAQEQISKDQYKGAMRNYGQEINPIT